MSVQGRLRDMVGVRGAALLHAGSWSLVAKVCAAANLFLSIPLAMRALDATQFGVWATLVSLMAFAGFLDFGFSNGTMNLLAAARGRDAGEEVAHVFRQSVAVLTVLAAWLAMALGLVWLMVPWNDLNGLPATMAGQSFAAIGCVLVAIVLSLPLNLGHRVRLGIGQGDRAFKWQAIGQLGALLVVAVVAKLNPSLTALTAAAVFAPLAASTANTISLLRDPRLRPVSVLPVNEGRRIRAAIRGEGSLFFILQLAAALAFSADLVLISFLHDPQEAGRYAVVQRLFSLVSLALSMAWAPLWPIYRSALAQGDFSWVSQTLSRSMLVAGVFAAGVSTIIIAGFDPIMHLLTGGPGQISILLLLGFGIWSVFEAVGTAVGTFLNSASVIRFQLASAMTFAVSCFTCKVLVVMSGDIALLPWAAIATYSLTFVIPLAIFWKRLLAAVKARSY
jgi:O-antigen/teichoic acid export membrane protein